MVEQADEVVAHIKAGETEYNYGKGNKVLIPEDEWHKLLVAAKGKKMTVVLTPIFLTVPWLLPTWVSSIWPSDSVAWRISQRAISSIPVRSVPRSWDIASTATAIRTTVQTI